VEGCGCPTFVLLRPASFSVLASLGTIPRWNPGMKGPGPGRDGGARRWRKKRAEGENGAGTREENETAVGGSDAGFFSRPGGPAGPPHPPPSGGWGVSDLKKKPVPHGGIEKVGPVVEGREAWRGNVGNPLPL